MTSDTKYTTAQALRMALEERLKNIVKKSGKDIMRLRRNVAFDRFLARIFNTPVKGLVAKGGYTLDLRINQARTTKDIDFSFNGTLDGYWNGESEGLEMFFQEKAKIDLNDFFIYNIGTATMDIDNAVYGGFRFPVDVQMAGRRFAEFSIDVAAGDVWIEPHEMLLMNDWLGFAGIPTSYFPVITLEQQFSEKLHAYTRLRDHENSRVKDLVDMVLMITKKEMSIIKIRNIVKKTFSKCSDSNYPVVFSNPPDNWENRYSDLAKLCGIEEHINDAVNIVREYCVTAGLV